MGDIVLTGLVIVGLGIIGVLILFISTLALIYSVKLAIDLVRYGL